MSGKTGRAVVIGAGHGGGGVVAQLRQSGHDGEITLIGDEPIPPYHRPPLSKAWLKGEATGESLALRSPHYYAEHKIDLRLDTSVVKIDRQAHEVVLAGGERLGWDHLILATGARARALAVAGAESRGVYALRNAADAESLKHALVPGARLAVVGGGYIGLEVAASARALGAEVAVIERETRLLKRVASPPLSAFFETYHRRQGVTIDTAADVDGFETRDGAVSGVLLRDGRVIDCDVALVGIGAIPNDDLARDCGLACEVGVVVDLQARTSDPAIYAVGDVTYRPLPFYDRHGRVESVPNASEQARQAAHAIMGLPAPADEVPWFWSDQYDVKLQIAGIGFDADELVVRGDPDQGKFAVFHMRAGRVLAVEAVNAASEFVIGRKLVGARTLVAREKLADMAIPMKAVSA